MGSPWDFITAEFCEDFNDIPEAIFTRIKKCGDHFEDFGFTETGITVECHFNYEGYGLVAGDYGSMVLESTYGGNVSFSITFSIKADRI